MKAIDATAAAMRGHLTDRDLARFDSKLGRDAAGEDPDAVDVSPLGLGVALAGALGLLVAAFLPFAESTTFGRVAQNTLIEQGIGWFLIGLALSELFAIYRMYVSKRPNPWPLIAGVLAVGGAIYYGTSDSNLRLCPAGGNPLDLPCETANPGIGIYAAGVAGLLMIVGGWHLFRSRGRGRAVAAVEPEDTKACPECAETVKVAARVCRYCGYRFPEAPASAAPP